MVSSRFKSAFPYFAYSNAETIFVETRNLIYLVNFCINNSFSWGRHEFNFLMILLNRFEWKLV